MFLPLKEMDTLFRDRRSQEFPGLLICYKVALTWSRSPDLGQVAVMALVMALGMILVKHWNSLPRLKSPSMEIFKRCGDTTLREMA